MQKRILGSLEVIVPIPGMDKIEYIDDNIQSVNVALTQEDLREIEDGLAKIEIQGARLSQDLLSISE